MTRMTLFWLLILTTGCGTLPDGSPAPVEFRPVKPRHAIFGPVLAVHRVVDERPDAVEANGSWRFLVPFLDPSRVHDSRPERAGHPVLDAPVDLQHALMEAATGERLFSEVVASSVLGEGLERAAPGSHWILEPRLTRLDVEVTTTSHRCGFLLAPFWLLGVPTGHVTTRMDLVVTLTSADGSRRWEGLLRGQRRRVRALWFHRDVGAIVAEDVASIFAEGWHARSRDLAAVIGEEG